MAEKLKNLTPNDVDEINKIFMNTFGGFIKANGLSNFLNKMNPATKLNILKKHSVFKRGKLVKNGNELAYSYSTT